MAVKLTQRTGYARRIGQLRLSLKLLARFMRNTRWQPSLVMTRAIRIFALLQPALKNWWTKREHVRAKSSVLSPEFQELGRHSGLNVASRKRDAEQPTHAVFLSGNGPLVAVLREALTRDELDRQRRHGLQVRKREIGERIKAFIQNVHHFRDDILVDPGNDGHFG